MPHLFKRRAQGNLVFSRLKTQKLQNLSRDADRSKYDRKQVMREGMNRLDKKSSGDAWRETGYRSPKTVIYYTFQEGSLLRLP